MLPRASGVPCSTSQSVCGGRVGSRTSCSAAHRNRCCEYRSTVLSEAGGPDHCVALAAEALHLCQWAWRPSLTSEVPMVAMARRRETGCAHVSRCVHGVSCEQWPGHDRLIGCAGQNVASYRAAMSARATAIRQVWAAPGREINQQETEPQLLLLQTPPRPHTAHSSLNYPTQQTAAGPQMEMACTESADSILCTCHASVPAPRGSSLHLVQPLTVPRHPAVAPLV